MSSAERPWEQDEAYVSMRDVFMRRLPGERADDERSYFFTDAMEAREELEALGFSDLHITVATAIADIDVANEAAKHPFPEDFDG